jgi:uncharacterized small protein (TIGR04563 family)
MRAVMNTGGQKRSFYFPIWMSREVEVEATRLDRSASWILQRAWKLARAELRRAPPRSPARPASQPAGSQAGKGAPP